MADASGSPSGFTAMLYKRFYGGPLPGLVNNLATLSGSLSPLNAGTYAYTAPSDLALSPSTEYFIVLTAGTAITNGAYEWDFASENSYNSSDGWSSQGGVWTSSNGSVSSWSSISGFPQFAINATAIPEPGILGLFVWGGLLFNLRRRQVRDKTS
jgi:hypothetical protein